MTDSASKASRQTFSAQKRAFSNPVLATVVFVLTELMFFTALISAYLVIRAGTGEWAPPESVRLPVVATLFNTLVLLLSGVLMFVATRAFAGEGASSKVKTLYGWSMALGCTFVGIQGYEWVELIKFGMTMTSGVFSACFFLIIGCHGIHAISAILAMLALFISMVRGSAKPDHLVAMTIYWSLIVGVWPILFGLVYF
jgi:cytochrome c oxidase subunit III